MLGYIFRGADHWGQQAYQKIEDPIPNHSSKYVWEECFGAQYDDGSFYKGKCGWIKKEIMQEARQVILKIKQNFKFQDIITQILEEEYRIADLVERLFREFGSNPNFIEDFINAFNDFEALCYKRYCELNDGIKIQKHDRRKGYNEIFDHLKKYISNDSDVEIVIDGHHLATQLPKVFFITGDFDDIYFNRTTILEKTSILDIIYLGNL
ncbi:MAG: hypothetical protein NTV10_00085 [Methanoregula sp.]|nr:hypothetical protein [Methanoregula sp.]